MLLAHKDKTMNICVIPARGGSKRIPRKNIRAFCGKPIIAWSIETARSCRCFDHVIVSTDDAEIADVAQQYGAEVPFLRPESLADDFTTTSDVVSHMVTALAKQDYAFDNVCCLYATSPFTRSEDLCRSEDELNWMKSSGAYIFSVVMYSHPIQRALKIVDEDKAIMKMVSSEMFESRSQDLEIHYHDAGQFYWAHKRTWQDNKNLFQGSAGVKIPAYRVQDIDNEEDWIRAEYMFQAMNASA